MLAIVQVLRIVKFPNLIINGQTTLCHITFKIAATELKITYQSGYFKFHSGLGLNVNQNFENSKKLLR
jgi:hypothetical protein